MEETSSERTPTMKKRRTPANDLEPSHQCLATPPTFKRICLTHGEYRAPLEDGAHYNDASHAALTIRQLADQAIARNLHQELQAEKKRIELEFRREIDKLRSEKNELKRSKNAAIAELKSTKDRLEITNRNQSTQNADLLSERQLEKEARIRAEEEHDAAVAKANEQPLQSNSSDLSTEFEPDDQTENIAAEAEQLLAAVQDATTCPEENSGERNTTDDSHSKLMAENFTNKAIHERLRGQTIPPKVAPRTQITAPPVRREEPELNAIDSRLLREAPTLYAQSMRGRQRRKENRAARDAARKDNDNDDNKVNTSKHVEEALKYREERHQEYTAAQQDFEEGRHDKLPLGKVMHDFREENWVSFSKAPDGRIRRNGVYAVQLEHDNTSVHILPFPGNERVTRRRNGLYAAACLNAQHPELQAEAAKEFLTEEEYAKFMERSFGTDWRNMMMSDGGIEAEAWQRAVKDLHRTKRFRTACRLWAAGEPALNQDRCWPPTFLSMEKTQACTHCNDEDERMGLVMSRMPGWPRGTVAPYYMKEASEEQVDGGDGIDGASRTLLESF